MVDLSIMGRALAWVYPCPILRTLYMVSQAPPKVSPECRTRIKPKALLGVAPKQKINF